MNGRCVVAVDGPSGSGKSTVSRRLAARLGARYLDTGAMYRAVTWAVLQAGADPHDTGTVAKIAGEIDLAISTDPDRPAVSVDGAAVDAEIRGPEVTAAVSAVAAVPEVRRLLVARQREIIAEAGRIVVEGRDIGTVVAPDADLKVFLTASVTERARRRSAELGGATAADLARATAADVGGATAADLARATAADLARRDKLDSTREVDPFRQASDAVVLDSTALGIDQVVARLAQLLRARQPRARARA